MSPVLTLGGFSSLDVTDVTKYQTVQDAIDSIPSSGGRLYFPRRGGPYTPETAAGWTIDKPMEIFGDGPNDEATGINYYGGASGHNSSVFVLSSSLLRNVYIHDLVVTGNGGAPAVSGTGDAIRFTGATSIGRVYLERLWLLYPGRSGIYFKGSSGSSYVIGITMREVYVEFAGGHGVYIEQGTMVNISGSGFNHNQGMGMVLASVNSGLHVQGDFSANGGRLSGTPTATLPSDNGTAYNGQLMLANCKGGMITGCTFEDFNLYPTKTLNGLSLNANDGCVVGGCEFHNAASVANSRGIQLVQGATGNTILSNAHSYVATTINIASATDEIGNTIFPQNVYNSDGTSPGILSIAAGVNRNIIFPTNVVGGVGDNKAVGIQFPRMSAEADIAAGVLNEGLQFYDNTSKTMKRRDDNSTDVVP